MGDVVFPLGKHDVGAVLGDNAQIFDPRAGENGVFRVAGPMNAVARPDVGKASGTFAMARYLGGIFGIAVLVTVFDRTGGLVSPAAFTAGFVPAMWAAAAFALAGALTALAATEPRPIVTPSLSRGRHHGGPAASRTIVRINSDN